GRKDENTSCVCARARAQLSMRNKPLVPAIIRTALHGRLTSGESYHRLCVSETTHGVGCCHCIDDMTVVNSPQSALGRRGGLKS
ncbi:hypothetical protein EVAR_70602_1, partial [Eumeta japonica]